MKILCAGGGTLGSVTPLLAVIEQIKKRQPEVTVEWWGTKNGPEHNLVVTADINFTPIVAGKLRRYLSWQNILDIVRIFIGFCQAIWHLAKSKPDCLLTAGSYVAVPVAWAAYLFGVPVFIHQQDVRPSLANKLMLPIAKKISVSLPESLKDFSDGKTILTGNPVRQIFLNPPDQESAKKKLNLDPVRPVLLVMGGGTGAKFLNDLVKDIKVELMKITQVVHVTGVGKNYNEAIDGYKVLPISNDSVVLLAAADLVVTRAGMGTLTELSALHKPAIVVPIAHSHQVDNAQYFADKGAVMLLKQEELTSQKLLATVRQLLNDKEACQKLGDTISKVLSVEAAYKLADLVEEQIKHG